MLINKLSFYKVLMVVGLSTLFAGCSTGMYVGGKLPWDRDSDPAEMGKRYLMGYGAPQDNQKAFYYFNKAAQSGDPFAQNELAYLYAAGKGTPKDYTQAFYWYQKAANHGLVSAQYNVGLFYLHGLGTPRNEAQALVWFRKSAEHGFEPARNALKKYDK